MLEPQSLPGVPNLQILFGIPDSNLNNPILMHTASRFRALGFRV